MWLCIVLMRDCVSKFDYTNEISYFLPQLDVFVYDYLSLSIYITMCTRICRELSLLVCVAWEDKIGLCVSFAYALENNNDLFSFSSLCVSRSILNDWHANKIKNKVLGDDDLQSEINENFQEGRI
jgi:hypothetical protein